MEQVHKNGDQVRTRTGKRGTVVGRVSGFILVRLDGHKCDALGYLPNELQPEPREEATADARQ